MCVREREGEREREREREDFIITPNSDGVKYLVVKQSNADVK